MTAPAAADRRDGDPDPGSADWPAPTATGPVDAEIRLPGSKSLTNRYLALAAVAADSSRLRRPLRSRDTLLMASGVAALGAGVADEPLPRAGAPAAGGAADPPEVDVADWVVTPIDAGDPGPAEPVGIDCGLAGTVMRFLPPVAAVCGRHARFDGDPRARRRPLRPLLAALRALGAGVEDAGGYLPATVDGRGGVQGGRIEIDASASSQFVSGLLLAGARCRDGLTVRHVGGPLPSRPHIAMTVENLRDCGVVVEDAGDEWRVEPGPVGGLDVEVEPDLSNAGPFLAAALATGGRVRVLGWPQYTTQAGDLFRDVLDAMGADVVLDRGGLTVTSGGAIYGVDLDLREAGEITPTVAALAALAESPSRLRGIGHLRGHETDRLRALADEIGALGGDVRVLDDGLEIRPRALHGGPWRSYDDHRMATTGAVIGLRVPGVVVDGVGTTAKTLPDFPRMWQALVGAAG
ncbi:MAG: 3-phosphoshikimate 1-carboxyvinyltransferase [Kineosporiaceae bacterium]